MYGNFKQKHPKYITNYLVIIVIFIFKLQEFLLIVFMFINI
jgi:hypothetical protein